MGRSELRDLVVVLPGITGSVLQRDGKDVWAASPSAAFGWIVTKGHSLSDLKLPDGGTTVATRMMRDVHLVPGLYKVDGYSALLAKVRERFEVVDGVDADPLVANLVEFPYDWRQDNRQSAERLGEVIEDRLDRWRKWSGNDDAKAILLAHSMGGLVSRYWLECLGGWRDCRALFTFGTPHRGSLSALDFLANGYKKLVLDLTEAMRSFPSVHQLLPIYEALSADGTVNRVAELPGGVPGVDATMAADGLRFHREIEEAVEQNRKDAAYLREPYVQIPFVGTRQPTKQSAELASGKLTVSTAIPTGIDSLLEGGDGTVPQVSATPIELSDSHLETFRPERHGSLQANPTILGDVADRIRNLQAKGLGNVKAAKVEPGAGPSLSLALDDAYVAEPVVLEATLLDGGALSAPLTATIERVGSAEPSQTLPMPGKEGRHRLEVELPLGSTGSRSGWKAAASGHRRLCMTSSRSSRPGDERSRPRHRDRRLPQQPTDERRQRRQALPPDPGGPRARLAGGDHSSEHRLERRRAG